MSLPTNHNISRSELFVLNVVGAAAFAAYALYAYLRAQPQIARRSIIIAIALAAIAAFATR